MNKKWILAGMAALTAMSVLAGCCGTQSDKTPAKTNSLLSGRNRHSRLLKWQKMIRILALI